MSSRPIIRSAATSWQDETSGLGKRPMIFDILGPDRETSILPDDLRMVLHYNPSSMSISYARQVERIQTRGGWVEQHWGDSTEGIQLQQTTGGFVRLYSGLSNVTNPARGGTRRETIAYDKYLDLLALFHNNGSVYDSRGTIVLQGVIKLTFDGGVYHGWFSDFSVTESASMPYQFTLSMGFVVDKEVMSWRSTLSATESLASSASDPGTAHAGPPILAGEG